MVNDSARRHGNRRLHLPSAMLVRLVPGAATLYVPSHPGPCAGLRAALTACLTLTRGCIRKVVKTLNILRRTRWTDGPLFRTGLLPATSDVQLVKSHERFGRYRGASPQFETITPPARQRLCLSPIRNYRLVYLRKGGSAIPHRVKTGCLLAQNL